MCTGEYFVWADINEIEFELFTMNCIKTNNLVYFKF